MISAEINAAALSADPAVIDSPAPTHVRAEPSAEPAIDMAVLTARLARGDEAAFHEFYGRYFNRLLRYLLVVSNGQEEAAREALQLTLVRVAKHVRRFDTEAVFWKWLTVLARSALADEQRKGGRYQSLLARFFHSRPADAPPQPDDAEQRFLQLVRGGLEELPADERTLMQRKYFDGEGVRELAAEWEISEKAMESRLLRIRQKLKTAVLDRLKHETSD